jgi:hypothetical protein
MSRHTLCAWKKKFDTEGPVGLMHRPRGGPRGSRLPDLVTRAILMLKHSAEQLLVTHKSVVGAVVCSA